ncbi:metalloprotease family protein [Clostridioides difficile]
MIITIGRFIKKKGDYDSENIICPIEDYNRDKFLNRRIFVRVLFALLYCFGFGYMLAFNSGSIKDVKISILNFVLFYIVSFYLIQIPHEFIHTIFYKMPFKNKKNRLVFFNKKRIVTTELEENIRPVMLCISLITPFILFTIIPLITIKYIGFDLYLYSLSFANAILSSDDIVNIVLQLFVKKGDNGYKKLFVIPNNYDYLIENSNTQTIAIEDEEKLEDDNLSAFEKQLIKDLIDDTTILESNKEDNTLINTDNTIESINSNDEVQNNKVQENTNVDEDEIDVIEDDETLENSYESEDINKLESSSVSESDINIVSIGETDDDNID